MVTIHTIFAGKEYLWLGKVVRTEAGLDAKSRVQYVVAEVDDPYALKSKSKKLFWALFIASVIQSLYKTIISFTSNFISCSLSSLEISLIIQRATQPDFILNVLFCLCL